MSRGIVLWPDDASKRAVRRVWDELAKRGLPSLATFTHRRHQPHVSLTVGDNLPADKALTVLGTVPAQPLRLQVEAAGAFPGGVLFLACVAHPELLHEQRRVHDTVEPLMLSPWPYYRPGRWTPHITCALGCAPDQLSEALAVLLDHVPIEGTLDRGGVEDGTTGEHWPAQSTKRPPGPCAAMRSGPALA